MQRDDLALVEDMLMEISDAIEFVQGYDLRTFLEDRRTGKAAAYSIQIMGEAARGIMWAVVQEDLPRLQASLLNATEG